MKYGNENNEAAYGWQPMYTLELCKKNILSHIENLKNSHATVLSMYDGMSCGQIALEKLGVEITNYFATEIDKYSCETTLTNYPKTIQLGDAFQVRNKDFNWEQEY